MAANSVFGIVVETSTPLQIEQVQAVVKEHAGGWWHNIGDFWLVTGRSAREWRDLIGPIFPTVASGKVLVLKIDTASPATWASRAALSDSAKEWLHKQL